jgi:hypothetical protein
MACYIFLKSLRSLEEFRKNPHVKIPPKSPSTNFQSLGKFKNPSFSSEIPFSLFSARLTLRPTWPLAQPAHWSRHAAPPLQDETVSAGPPSSRIDRVFTGNMFSLLVHAFRAGRLSLVPLTIGPWLSALSPSSSHPSSTAPPSIPGHRAPPSSAPRVPPSRYHLAFISPPLIILLNPPPSSMAFKAINASVNPPGHPSPALPRPL